MDEARRPPPVAQRVERRVELREAPQHVQCLGAATAGVARRRRVRLVRPQNPGRWLRPGAHARAPGPPRRHLAMPHAQRAPQRGAHIHRKRP
jgi:hypothetical protein